MYTPKHFDQPSVAEMHRLMRARPLATLVTLASDGLNANHIPLHLSESPQPFGMLQGHVARANPIWRDLSVEVEALAVFHGTDAYITPAWYATKKETGKVVPTWNYAVVHASGTLRVIDDAEWLRAQIEKLTAQHESELAEPWKTSDAPPEFTEKLVSALIGVEIVITKLQGKWKVSQNQPARNQAGVVSGLQERNEPESILMANLILENAKSLG